MPDRGKPRRNESCFARRVSRRAECPRIYRGGKAFWLGARAANGPNGRPGHGARQGGIGRSQRRVREPFRSRDIKRSTTNREDAMPRLEFRRDGNFQALSDADLVRLALQRDGEAFREIMQRHNRRLYRVARSVVHDDSEAEDVVQEAYVLAFGNLAKFRAESSLATWLTRITLNEALGRLRRRRPTVDLSILDAPQGGGAQVIPFPTMTANEDPERMAAQHEIRRLIEQAIDELPEIFASCSSCVMWRT